MSDSDDWEAGLDSDNEEKKVEEEKQSKKAAFDDEDKVDPIVEEKKKKEAAKKAALEAQQNGRVKTTNKVDYDKEWEERQKKLASSAVKPVDTTGMTAAQKGLAMEQAQEAQMADALFGEDEKQPNTVSKVSLTSEKEYKAYGENVGKVLYSGSFPVRIEAFYKEMSKDLPQHCDSKQIKKIADHLQSMYNTKLQEEKKAAKTKKKPAAGSKTMAYDNTRNNNMAMVADVMGAADDDDDYQDGGQGFRREEEAEYDFM